MRSVCNLAFTFVDQDGQRLGLVGMIASMIDECNVPSAGSVPDLDAVLTGDDAVLTGDDQPLARAISLLEEGHAPEGWREQVHAAAARRSTPVLGITLLLLIAERALGVGIFDPSLGGDPVLYQHFPGKLELYLAVLDESSDSLIDRVRIALDSTTDNRKRVRATFEAYFDFVAHESGSFRLIFESDLTNVPEVAERVTRTNEICGQLIAEVIREDTDLDDDTSMLLASGLLGMAQTAARYWLHSPAPISQESAAKAMSMLAWRGISEFPLTHPPS